MLSAKIKRNIKLAAQQVSVQKALLNAMFHGCEYGTDIFEYLDSNAKLSGIALELIYGPKHGDPKTPEEESDWEDQNIKFGAIYYDGHEAAIKLINQVKKNISKKLVCQKRLK